MTASILRAAIVGASTLLGKELADQLNAAAGAAWDLTLLDTEESAGQVTAAGDEPLVIQALTPESFTGVDIVFFAADVATTQEHWRHAVRAGASVIDVSGALAGERDIVTRAPLLAAAGVQDARLNLSTEAVVAAHPVSLLLGAIAARLRGAASANSTLAATVLLPVSEQGKAGMDELHAQTVALLSFASVPRDLYDAQVTFNINAGLGQDARVDLSATERRVRTELQSLLSNDAPRYALQCLQAPVFHGCSASIYLQANGTPEAVKALSQALPAASVLSVVEDDVLPSNVTVAEQDEIQVAIRADASGTGMWLWVVADNLRLQARNAIACAGELLAIRPAVSRVQ